MSQHLQQLECPQFSDIPTHFDVLSAVNTDSVTNEEIPAEFWCAKDKNN